MSQIAISEQPASAPNVIHVALCPICQKPAELPGIVYFDSHRDFCNSAFHHRAVDEGQRKARYPGAAEDGDCIYCGLNLAVCLCPENRVDEGQR